MDNLLIGFTCFAFGFFGAAIIVTNTTNKENDALTMRLIETNNATYKDGTLVITNDQIRYIIKGTK